MTSSLHLLRSQLMELQFAQVKNLATKPLDVSLPPFHTGATRLESSAYFWDRADLYTTFASLKSVYFNLAYLQTSLGFVCHPFTSPSVGEKWMRDKRTPKDVYGEANLNPKSNVRVDTSRNPFQSCLVFHSILDLFLFEQTLTHPTTIFYLVRLKTVFKGTWTEEVRNA